MNTFFLRGGYNFLMENTDQSVYGFTAGAGIDYKLTDDIGVVFDYAYRDVQDFPTANHIFTVKLAFQLALLIKLINGVFNCEDAFVFNSGTNMKIISSIRSIVLIISILSCSAVKHKTCSTLITHNLVMIQLQITWSFITPLIRVQ